MQASGIFNRDVVYATRAVIVQTSRRSEVEHQSHVARRRLRSMIFVNAPAKEIRCSSFFTTETMKPYPVRGSELSQAHLTDPM